MHPPPHTQTQGVTVRGENVGNTRRRCIRGEIMPNPHEGHRDRCKLVALEGAPSQVDRRQEPRVLGAAEHRASGTRQRPTQTAP